MNKPQVWHHQPPEKVGPEVIALTGQPGMMGWMPFVRSWAIARVIDKRWVFQPHAFTERILELGDDIERSGFLMLDLEKPLGDPGATDLYIEMSQHASDNLDDMGLEETVLGWYRLPDHVENQRFTQVGVLPYVSGIFSLLTSSREDRTLSYAKDIIRLAPRKTHVAYFDAWNNRTGVDYTQSEIIDRVRRAHGALVNPQIVFRQQGPSVAKAMKWVAEWLD